MWSPRTQQRYSPQEKGVTEHEGGGKTTTRGVVVRGVYQESTATSPPPTVGHCSDYSAEIHTALGRAILALVRVSSTAMTLASMLLPLLLSEDMPILAIPVLIGTPMPKPYRPASSPARGEWFSAAPAWSPLRLDDRHRYWTGPPTSPPGSGHPSSFCRLICLD